MGGAAPSPTGPFRFRGACRPCRCGPAATRAWVEVVFCERERFVNAESAAPEHDDQRAHTPPVEALHGEAHDGDDLLDGRRVGGIELALVARRAPGVIARQGRRRTAPTGGIENYGHGHEISSQSHSGQLPLLYQRPARHREVTAQMARPLPLGNAQPDNRLPRRPRLVHSDRLALNLRDARKHGKGAANAVPSLHDDPTVESLGKEQECWPTWVRGCSRACLGRSVRLRPARQRPASATSGPSGGHSRSADCGRSGIAGPGAGRLTRTWRAVIAVGM
jgi:hypothetical protein